MNPILETWNHPVMPLVAKRSRVLLALPAGVLSSVSLFRAMAFARLRDAELHVLRVLPVRPSSFPLFPQLNGVMALENINRDHESVEATRAWLDDAAGETFALEVRSGSFVAETTKRAQELCAELVVMPPAEGRFGATATDLAQAAGVPVLVARPPMAEDVIIAASDLSDRQYPVLRQATELGAALEAPVVAMHNVVPVGVYATPELSWPLTLDVTESVAQAKHTELEQAALKLRGHAQAVVTTGVSCSEAILREARARDADLVVVGTREQSLLEWLFDGSVAARVVEASRRSVLVVPLNTQPEQLTDA
ncbi:MAG: universal stress protein [Archangium sp.]|nr:universal stress protein [Archangium sp.]